MRRSPEKASQAWREPRACGDTWMGREVRGRKFVRVGLRLSGPSVGPRTVPGPGPSEMVKNNHYLTNGETVSKAKRDLLKVTQP